MCRHRSENIITQQHVCRHRQHGLRWICCDAYVNSMLISHTCFLFQHLFLPLDIQPSLPYLPHIDMLLYGAPIRLCSDVWCDVCVEEGEEGVETREGDAECGTWDNMCRIRQNTLTRHAYTHTHRRTQYHPHCAATSHNIPM